MVNKDATSKQPAPSFSDVFKVLLILLSIYLYFTGFLYSYYLFGHFGISTQELNIPVYQFFVYSFPVLTGKGAISYIIILLIILCMIGLYYLILINIRKNLCTFLLLLIILALFPILDWLSLNKSITIANDYKNSQYGKRVIFTFKKTDKENYPKNFLEHNKKGNLILLTESKDRFYVILPSIERKRATIDDQEEIAEKTVALLYNVPKSQVLLTTTLILLE